MERTFTHPKTGKPAVMNTANIGKRAPTAIAAPTSAMAQHQRDLDLVVGFVERLAPGENRRRDRR
jgi:hypothetical protein